MQDQNPGFRKPSKKHQPKGLQILYEDHEVLVVNKSSGLLTISTGRDNQRTAHALLNDYVRKGNSKSRNRVFIVHRLDQDTSGLLVFAKNEGSKHFLQEHWQEFSKVYLAVVRGKPEPEVGTITSFLRENKAHRVHSVSNPEMGKASETGYRLLKAGRNFSLLELKLETGRKHQIRVHCADMGHPVAGDKMYGTLARKSPRLALHATSLTFVHPYSKKPMTFEADMPRIFTVMLKG